MKIGILQTGRSPDELRESHGDYDAMCADLIRDKGDEIVSYPVLDGVFPQDINECDAWFVTGSRHGVYEDHAWIPPLEKFLKQAFDAEKKIIGVCFGHQILAQALGGKVHKHPGGFAIGVMDYDLVNDDGNMEKISLCAWHQDQILELPANAEVIAKSDFCRFAGVTYGTNAISFQAHPEFEPAYVRELINLRRDNGIDEKLAQNGLASLKKVVDGSRISKRLKQFLNTSGK